MSMVAGRVIVYGGRGALGSAILEHFKINNFWTLCIDLLANDRADVSVLAENEDDWIVQGEKILKGVSSVLESPVDAIFCVAGGWAGGNAGADDFIKIANTMWQQSVWSSVIAARIAAKHLKPGGLLQLTGAYAATGATASMIGYGMAKAAVHQLTKSLAEKGSGLPPDSTVLTTLPIILDTPMNRKWMPKADHSTWTPMSWIAERLMEWTKDSNKRPASGTLLQLKTDGGNTVVVEV